MNLVCNCLINQSAINWCQNIDFTGARVGIAVSIAVILIAIKVNESTQQPLRIEPLDQRVHQELPLSRLDFSGLIQHFSGMRSFDTTPNKEQFRAEWKDLYQGLPEVDKTRMARAVVHVTQALGEFARSLQNEDGQDLAKVFIQNPLSSHWSVSEEMALGLHDLLVRQALEYCHQEQLLQIAQMPDSQPLPIDPPKQPEGKGKEEIIEESALGTT